MMLRLTQFIALQFVFINFVTGQTVEYFFNSDLENLETQYGLWKWQNRTSMNWALPPENDGFAVLSAGGDVIYDSSVNLEYGLDYTIRFFVASEYVASTTIQLQQLMKDGPGVIVLEDKSSLSGPDNTEWFELTGTIAPSSLESTLGIFCQTNGENTPGEKLYGCAIDYMKFEMNTLEYTFESSTEGWVLGRSNGAIWRRVRSDNSSVEPISGEYALQVLPVDIYSGTVVAMSPRMKVGPIGLIRITIDFYLSASFAYPVYLKLRRRLSFTTYDPEPAFNLDTFGDQHNKIWLSHTNTYSDLTAGEEFNLILEGGLGIQNDENTIVVSRILVEGAVETDYDEVTFFDFTDGLVGWQSGCNDGGKWEALPYDRVPPHLNVPEPSSGQVLLVDRYDIHSGIITIESPPIAVSPMSAKQLQTKFWIYGSMEYPVHFRVGLKTLDGVYTTPPFLDLSPYGDSMSSAWMELESLQPIPANPKEDYFQLVLEVDLGANGDNRIAIDSITISTTSGSSDSNDFSVTPKVLGYKKNDNAVNRDVLNYITPSLKPFSNSDDTTLRSTLDYSFEFDTQGWTLGRSNGAAWRRVISNYDVDPFEGQSPVLQAYPVDIYSGTVEAMSPRLAVGSTGNISITIEFYMLATSEYPTYLKLRRRLSFSEYEKQPWMNLDSFGNHPNNGWLSYSGAWSNLPVGEQFNLVLEGGLGALNYEHSVAVSRIIVTGAEEVALDENTFFDFSDGLVGWQSGSKDGGKWISIPYAMLNPNLNVPPPSSGQVLMVDRYDIHSGTITIESPPIVLAALTTKQMQIHFWIKGSAVYPVSFRIGLKTMDGSYDELPFLNLIEYGNSDSQVWYRLERYVDIPARPANNYFQLVLEADLGADLKNQIVIDNIHIVTLTAPTAE